jgi:hypothetical protein
MPTLKELDQAFNDLWMHTEQLPTLLDKWQELVSEQLATLGEDKADLDAFESKMRIWQNTLEENRALLIAHQANLKRQISTGEPNPLSIKKTQKYSKGR